MRADGKGMWLYVFFFEDIENRETRRTSDRVAAKRAEKFHAVVERTGDFRRGNDGCERKRIADRLAENHDVRNPALRFESPKMRPKTPEPDLDFVGDTDRARTAHVAVNLCQVIRRKNDLAADAWQRFRHVSTDAMALGARVRENFRNVMRVLCARLFVVAAIWSTVIVR